MSSELITKQIKWERKVTIQSYLGPLHDTFDRNCFLVYFISHCYTINSNYFQSIYNTNEQSESLILHRQKISKNFGSCTVEPR